MNTEIRYDRTNKKCIITLNKNNFFGCPIDLVLDEENLEFTIKELLVVYMEIKDMKDHKSKIIFYKEENEEKEF